MKIDFEPLTGNALIVVYAYGVTHWGTPFESESIDTEGRERIVANLREWFHAKGAAIDVAQDPAVAFPMTLDRSKLIE